jgi:hypothetical protein
MRHLRHILSTVLTVVRLSLLSSLGNGIFAQPDDLTPIYTNSAPEQFAWSLDSQTFVFLGSTAQRGVEIVDSHCIRMMLLLQRSITLRCGRCNPF